MANVSVIALLGYAAWTLCLLAAIAVLRVVLTLRGPRSANSFSVWGDDVSPFSGRLCRAHANCYENLPAFASIVVVAAISGHPSITDPLALWALAARVGQSTVHLISTHNRAVQLRFAFLLAQFVIQTIWITQLIDVVLF
jgi:uncharacterized MAPEG superfamily protein